MLYVVCCNPRNLGSVVNNCYNMHTYFYKLAYFFFNTSPCPFLLFFKSDWNYVEGGIYGDGSFNTDKSATRTDCLSHGSLL